jgi:HSP20 family protein
MANITIQKILNAAPATISQELSSIFDEIRNRAFDLFERRGSVPGQDLDDWIQAEKELFFVPQAEWSETDAEFKITVAVPGYEAANVHITAQPNEILLRGNAEKQFKKKDDGVSYSEFAEKSMYRRFPLAAPIDVKRTTATIENGILTVTAPKEKPEAANKAAA